MRSGFTTGSCSAAAAKAAAYTLLSGIKKETITIETPRGISFTAKLVDYLVAEDAVSCSVIKDGGDDPDVTTGAHVTARVEYAQGALGEILIDGGVGVGRITRPGLDQPVGEAAINSVPRQMIAKEVGEVCKLLDYTAALKVTISVPEGEELAEKTFNPRLGIEGGISILGTSGVVEPMSQQALIDTIRVELTQQVCEGRKSLCISPGNYGLDFMKKNYDFDLDKAVKCSNYIGATIDLARELGAEELLLVGHIGKLVKLAGGIMNTHSREADCRMELLAAAAARIKFNGYEKAMPELLSCLTTEEAYQVLVSYGIAEETMHILMERIAFYLQKRAGEKLKMECIVYSNEAGLLGKTAGADELMRKIRD